MIPKDYAYGGFASFTGIYAAVELAEIAGMAGDAAVAAGIGVLGAGFSLASIWYGKSC